MTSRANPLTSLNPQFAAPLPNPAGMQQIHTVPLWQHLVTFPISSQVTVGLAKIFDFEVLTHGTCFRNSFGILKNGGDPSKGGSTNGSTQITVGIGGMDPADSQMVNAARMRFYVFKDTEKRERDGNGGFRELTCIESIACSGLHRMHAALSGAAQAGDGQGILATAMKIVYAVFNFLFSPTIRFIYSKEEITGIFGDDPDYGGKAYRTAEHLPNDRIGLIGVCSHASFEGLQRGLNERPLRVLAGAVQVVAGVALTSVGLGLIT